jgi:hypothetical protein
VPIAFLLPLDHNTNQRVSLNSGGKCVKITANQNYIETFKERNGINVNRVEAEFDNKLSQHDV